MMISADDTERRALFALSTAGLKRQSYCQVAASPKARWSSQNMAEPKYRVSAFSYFDESILPSRCPPIGR
jgi:hypothetical protein